MVPNASDLQSTLTILTQTRRGVSEHPAQMISVCQSPEDPRPSYFYIHTHAYLENRYTDR